MNKNAQSETNAINPLADDVRALMAETAHIAGEKVSDARQRLTAALANGEKIFNKVKDKTMEGVKVTDTAVRENPYQAIAIAIGVGAFVGYLASRRCNCNKGN